MSQIKNRKPIFLLILFLICVVLTLFGLNTAFAFTNTLFRLDRIETQRDTWQRPGEIIQALQLHAGNTVADLGSGSGYFALKLSWVVGPQGRVSAVDLRKLSLFFLWTRAMLKGDHNINVIVGDESDPHLPADTVDSVLICNTYHEFRHPSEMLKHSFRALKTEGRLVVVDRSVSNPDSANHEVALSVVEGDLRQHGFEVLKQEDPFLTPAGDEPWWLLVARKP